MRHILASLLALLAMSYLGACQTSGAEEATEGDIARCRLLCESNKSCDGADTGRSCMTYCINLDSIIVGGRCRIRYQNLLDCDEALEDLCDAAAECAMELADYDSCVATYCAGHREQCADVSGPF
ncbi:MAG TPA: hypothetical protein VFZ53_30940 [Polyangiaceae bacterium]